MKDKKRIYCHTCEREYVITSEENNKKLQKDYICDHCNSNFIHVEKDRGHSIAHQFVIHNIVY